MTYSPHTKTDITQMLKEINVNSIDDLFTEIPKQLQIKPDSLKKVPPGLTELELTKLMQTKAKQSAHTLNFVGAGAYEHYIPAAIWDIVSRGEYLTAYTPYQAEASQGNLQLMYEYQTMVSNLLSMDASNASMYDGASALAEAILMAVRVKQKTNIRKVLLPKTLNPLYSDTIKSIIKTQNIEIEEIEFSAKDGTIDFNSLENAAKNNFTALVIPQPNFFGQLEDVDLLVNFAHDHDALAIAVVNPIAMALLQPPGKWGNNGADIACGEGQPLGVPLSSGGPYFGFMCTKKEFLRQIPGRIVGKTVDANGKRGFVLTLQAREQHIRRSKATSNICTNQGLLVIAATIYMSLMGAKGLKNVATISHQNKNSLIEKLKQIKDITILFSNNSFHEFVIKFDDKIDLRSIYQKMLDKGVHPGIQLSENYPELKNCLLVCVTETKTEQDIDTFVEILKGLI